MSSASEKPSHEIRKWCQRKCISHICLTCSPSQCPDTPHSPCTTLSPPPPHHTLPTLPPHSPTHTPHSSTHSLLLYGMTCCLQERYSEAEQFFEMATTSDPGNIIAWTMRGNQPLIAGTYPHILFNCAHKFIGLFYEHSGNGIYQDMCYQEANKFNSSHAQKTFVTPGGGAGQTPPLAGGPGQKAACSQSKASITSKQTGAARLPVLPVRVYYSHLFSSSHPALCCLQY